MKRLLNQIVDSETINILYFNDVLQYMCQFFTIKELLLLETLSTFHLNIIRSTPLHQHFKPAMQIGYLKLIVMIQNHQFKHLDLSGTFLHNKHIHQLKNPTYLNISNTFVSEKGLKMLKGPYDQLIVSKDLLHHIFNYDYIDNNLNDLAFYKNLVNATCPSGNTILMASIHYPISDKCFNYMIKHVDINAKNNENMTVLHYAIINKPNLIKILLENHVLVDQSHIHCALIHKIDMIEQLLSFCNHFDCQCDKLYILPKCCMSLALYNKDDKIAELIMKKMNHYQCALKMAVYIENIPFVKMLIKYGAKSDAGNLICAINNKNLEIINLLPDLDTINYKGRSGIMHACKQHNMDMVKHLVKLGANTTLKDKYGWHLLSLYLKDPYCKLTDVQYLVTLCDVNEVDNQGFSALMIAMINDLDDIVIYLISISNINLVNQSYHNALYVALEHNQNIEVVKALVDKNINLHINNDFKLFIWGMYHHCPNEIIDYLLDLNIDDVYHDDNHALIYFIQENYPVTLFDKMVKKYITNAQLMTQCYDIANKLDFSNMFSLFNNLQIVQRLHTIKSEIKND